MLILFVLLLLQFVNRSCAQQPRKQQALFAIFGQNNFYQQVFV